MTHSLHADIGSVLVRVIRGMVDWSESRRFKQHDKKDPAYDR